ncbi:MAG: PHP domain-containing protein, partial [Acidimicrobiia bacterium]|nr:PHP domain-containing protein [Acidimicrobiia bacterium]
MGYAELHCHTNFSFLDGASHPRALVERAVRLGYPALAVTDHHGFYGLVKFWQAARDAGLPAVYGVEIGLPRKAGVISYQSSVISDPLERATRRDGEKVGTENWELTTDNSAGPRRGRTKRMHGSKPIDSPPTDHLVLLAPSPQGYAALSRLVSRAQFRGEKD